VASPPGIYVQLPVFVILWAATVLYLLRDRLVHGWRRLAVGLAAVAGGLVTLIMFRWPWSVLPSLLQVIQFPMRLSTYAVLCIAGIVIVALRTLEGADATTRRRALWALAGVLWFGTTVAVWQVWSQPSAHASREVALTDPDVVGASVYDTHLFRDGEAPIVEVDEDRAVRFDPADVHHDVYEGQVDLPEGDEPIATNIAAGPYLVDVDGARIVGRTDEGWMVIEREGDLQGPVQMRLQPADSLPVVAGRLITPLCLGTLLVVLVVVAVRSLRR
jgi:hypothetical protein